MQEKHFCRKKFQTSIFGLPPCLKNGRKTLKFDTKSQKSTQKRSIRNILGEYLESIFTHNRRCFLWCDGPRWFVDFVKFKCQSFVCCLFFVLNWTYDQNLYEKKSLCRKVFEFPVFISLHNSVAAKRKLNPIEHS